MVRRQHRFHLSEPGAGGFRLPSRSRSAGAGFKSESTVNLGTTARRPSYVSPTQLTANVTAGSDELRVGGRDGFNPMPGVVVADRAAHLYDLVGRDGHGMVYGSGGDKRCTVTVPARCLRKYSCAG